MTLLVTRLLRRLASPARIVRRSYALANESCTLLDENCDILDRRNDLIDEQLKNGGVMEALCKSEFHAIGRRLKSNGRRIRAREKAIKKMKAIMIG